MIFGGERQHKNRTLNLSLLQAAVGPAPHPPLVFYLLLTAPSPQTGAAPLNTASSPFLSADRLSSSPIFQTFPLPAIPKQPKHSSSTFPPTSSSSRPNHTHIPLAKRHFLSFSSPDRFFPLNTEQLFPHQQPRTSSPSLSSSDPDPPRRRPSPVSADPSASFNQQRAPTAAATTRRGDHPFLRLNTASNLSHLHRSSSSRR